MSYILDCLENFPIFREIESHPAWKGNIPGLYAEKLLRGNPKPYVFLLREGECSTNPQERHYYITFTLPGGEVKHQPFIFSVSREGWSYENAVNRGPFQDTPIDEVLPWIMHCTPGECTPFMKK